MERLRQSPTDDGFVQDPYPFYRTARARGDFVFWEEYGLPMAVTHEAVMAVMKSRDLGREIPAEKRKPVPEGLEPFYRLEAHSMLEREPPAHTRLRRNALSGFTTSRIQSLAPEISQIADALIDAMPSGEFDLLEHFARPLPVRVIARLLGAPEDMAPQMLAWSNAMVAMYQARRSPEIEAAAAHAASEFSAFMAGHIDARRKTPANDLITDLIAAETSGGALSTDELIATCILLMNAGHEATVHSLGNAVRHLAGHPRRDEALAPSHVAIAVEECLRFDPPLHMFTRHVYRPVSILGQRFEPGDEIGCLLGSACHDDAIWPDAERFDPFRDPIPNAAFGAGIHFCVGAPLARLEMQIALPVLFSRAKDIRIVRPPRVANLYHFRGLERLDVVCC